MKFYKLKHGENFAEKEFKVNMLASFLGGAIGSALTNAFDVVTINKQANPEQKVLNII